MAESFMEAGASFYDLTGEDAVHGDWPALTRVRFAAAACESCGNRIPLPQAYVVVVDGDRDYIRWGTHGRMTIARWREMEHDAQRVSPGKCDKCGWCGFTAAGLWENE